MNATERQLRKFALIATAMLVLQLLWSGATLLQTSEPDPIYPVEASLRVDDVIYGMSAGEEFSRALVSRPLFWPDRQAYVPDHVEEIEAPVESRSSKTFNQTTLQGVYTGAAPGIIIYYDGEHRRVRLGESIEGWKFVELLPEGAVFSNGKDKKTFDLEHAFSVAPSPGGGGASELPVGQRSRQGSSDNQPTTGE